MTCQGVDLSDLPMNCQGVDLGNLPMTCQGVDLSDLPMTCQGVGLGNLPMTYQGVDLSDLSKGSNLSFLPGALALVVYKRVFVSVTCLTYQGYVFSYLPRRWSQ